MSKELLDFAVSLSEASRTVIKQYFRKPFDVIDKNDDSPVTVADRGAEQAMRTLIEDKYPDHGIFGEEFGVKDAVDDGIWVLDPIDGTRSFICGAPWFGTLIAYLEKNKPVLSVLDVPMMGERWVSDGQQTLFNDVPCQTRKGVSLDQASLFTTAREYFNADEDRVFCDVMEQAKCTRYGTDCYAYALLASGHIDLVIEAGLQPYDAMALVPVIEGAGGVVTGWKGEEVTLDWDGRILASGSKELHEQVLKKLEKL